MFKQAGVLLLSGNVGKLHCNQELGLPKEAGVLSLSRNVGKLHCNQELGLPKEGALSLKKGKFTVTVFKEAYLYTATMD